ncbi:MAG TPA: hypothetical protein VFQ62_24010 [Methylomirabilota bacterium]|nr:hypothetical protein [Methylomirabilota bacterium]
MSIAMPTVQCLPDHEDDLRQLGDEIAELAAHLDAATARLLDLIREFDARGGWGNGFRSCAEWLTWRIGLAPGAARRPITEATDVPAGTWNAGVDEPPAWGQLQADALALIAETGLHHGIDPGAAGERYQVVVHVDAAVLADAEAPGQAIVEGARVSAELVFRTPHGCRLPAVPVPVRAPVAAVENLRKKSPQIDERTSVPSWDGERLDLEWAISVLHPLACRPSVMGE